MKKSPLKLLAPKTEKRTVVPPGRKPNAELRTREHLTEDEVDRLIAAAKSKRWGHRNATMILVAFRHGLRVSELVDLRCRTRTQRLRGRFSAATFLRHPGSQGPFR
jgi:integrase